MLKVVLIDDEKIVLRGMSAIIQWKEEGLELAGTALDGKHGLELILTEKPDIVFTDIRMPGLSGLELIEAAKKELPDTVYIIMSGYNEFKYVQKAIGLGVIDYMEKPVTVEKYRDVLKKARELCSYRKNYRMLTQGYASLERKSIEKTLGKIYTAPMCREREWLNELENVSGQLWAAKEVCVLVLTPGNEDEPPLEVYRNLMETIIDTMKGESQVEIFAQMEQEFIIFTFFRKGRESVDFIGRGREVKRRFNEKGCLFYMGMGRVHSGVYELRSAYEEAKAALEYALYRDVSEIVQIDEVEYSSHIPEHLLEGQKSIEYNIRIGNEDAALEQAASYLHYLEGIQLKPVLFQHECLELIYLVLKLAEECGESYVSESGKTPHSEIEKYHAVAEMERWTTDKIRDILEWMHTMRTMAGNQTIQRVKNYIEEHYSSSISLELLAEYAGMSPTYLSMNFKKIVGTTYVKYLGKIRMEHAMEMLREGQKAKDVCEKVGYYDYKYFSAQFKKFTGMTPDRYKRRD